MLSAHTRLQPKHAASLVVGVLLLHIWILAGTPLWFSPESGKPLNTRVLMTRQIEVAPAREPKAAAPQPAPAPKAPPPLTAADAQTPAPPIKFDDLNAPFTDPVALPARSASAVDLPPYNRAAPQSGLTEATQFKAPESAVLKYQVQGLAKGMNYWASAEIQWAQDGKNYDARLEVSAFLLGARIQTSSGVLGAEGLMPTRFSDKNRSELAAHFQRDKGLISFSANSPDAPLLKGAQDRLSVVLQLSALLAADPLRFPSGTMLSFQTVSQREAEVWQFLVEKDELLQLPYGEVNAIKLNRKPRRDFDQHIELWFAPTMGYLPVRLRITNANGDAVDQLLKSVEKPRS